MLRDRIFSATILLLIFLASYLSKNPTYFLLLSIAASGILGKVKDISGAYVSIEIGENNIIKLQKSAIANILPKGTIDAIK